MTSRLISFEVQVIVDVQLELTGAWILMQGSWFLRVAASGPHKISAKYVGRADAAGSVHVQN